MTKKTALFLLGIGVLLTVILVWYKLPHQRSKQDYSTEVKLGQLFVVGLESTIISDKEREILKHIKPGGIVLYSRNISSVRQLTSLITQLQLITAESTGIPLFIFIDEEPSGAYRLGLYKDVFNTGYPDYDLIASQTKIASAIGINVILSPVMDYPLIRNSFIQSRIPKFMSIDDFIEFNESFIRVLYENRMLSTLKHFPGAGLLAKDTHESSSTFKGRDQLEKSLDIFSYGINTGAAFVMTVHAIYDDIDPNNLATFSNKVITQLRDNLSFQGVIITDDLSDMALIDQTVGLPNAGIKAIVAGHNMIMYSHGLQNTNRVFDELSVMAAKNNEFRMSIEQSFDFIQEVKMRELVKDYE